MAALIVILPLAACASQGSGLPLLETSKISDTDYRLGPGDKLHIQVLGAEDLTGDYAVGDNGTISTPLIGDIHAAGATRAGVERAMERKLAQGYLKNPKVSVTILQYRPFYIFGEVAKPGGYPFASGMRVVNAVATAGGYTYRANQDFVVVTRDGEERKALASTPIRPDDVIKVPERYF
ncbi:MAG: polysaccharide biosynthesis/export family protein [Stellaceae bacterium]